MRLSDDESGHTETILSSLENGFPKSQILESCFGSQQGLSPVQQMCSGNPYYRIAMYRHDQDFPPTAGVDRFRH